jgi:uncharacterized C2H2 Zn-finger protein
MEWIEYSITIFAGMILGAFITAIIMFRSFYKNQVDFFKHVDKQLHKMFSRPSQMPKGDMPKIEVFEANSPEEFKANLDKIFGKLHGTPSHGMIDGRSREWYIAKLNSHSIKFDPDSSVKELKKIYDLMIGDDDEI